MKTLIIVLASLAIFFSLLLKLKAKWQHGEQNALILYTYIFGPVSTILGSFCIDPDYHWLLVFSAGLYLCSAFFFVTNVTAPQSLQLLIGRLFLVGASGIVFGLSLIRSTEPLLKACQIFSYLSLYYVLVFDNGNV